MDFRFSEAEESYREEARAWILANIPPSWNRDEHLDFAEDSDSYDLIRDWHRALFDAGYVGVTWPKEYGGQGRSHVENAILQEELVRTGAPPTVNGLGIGLCGPAILHHGTEAQRRRFLRPMLRADELWCQGYSEPGSGSDLASLRTRAERRGDAWIVTGQKIWTSAGHRADWIFCLVRTEPNAPKHQGIGFLLIDMRSKGIEVRPLVQMTGAHGFSEVFFTEVEVPGENMVGEPAGGWEVANTVLGHERGASTLSRYSMYKRDFDSVVALARRTRGASGRVSDNPVARQRIAQAAIEVEILRLSSLRQLTALAQGRQPGPESSIQKLYYSEMGARLMALANDLTGVFGQLARRSPWAPDGGRWGQRELASRGPLIFAGTNEIQRNIIAQKVLGLPRS